MAATPRILAVNGSYRDDGITDQAVAAATGVLRAAGAQVETVFLRDEDIEFCHNCRACTQEPGAAPAQCVIDDDMRRIIDRIEQSDAYILAAPTNCGSVTALFRRFMERLVVYAYWPWGAPAPKNRKAKAAPKKALLVSSSAAPGILGRWVFGSRKALRDTARTIGAIPVGTVFTGLIADEPDRRLPMRARRKVEKLVRNLV